MTDLLSFDWHLSTDVLYVWTDLLAVKRLLRTNCAPENCCRKEISGQVKVCSSGIHEGGCVSFYFMSGDFNRVNHT